MPNVLLVVTRIDPFTKVISRRLEDFGCTVRMASNFEEARKTAGGEAPDVVVLDASLGFGGALREWIKIRAHDQLTSLIVLYPEEEGPEKLSGLVVLEDDYLIEPYEIEDLHNLIQSEYARIVQERKHFRQAVKLRVPPNAESVVKAGDFLERISREARLAEKERFLLISAVREALDNSCRYGRSLRPENAILLEYDLNPGQVAVTVEDEGKGFDAAAYLGEGLEGDAVALVRRRVAGQKGCGLGIMLMVRCADRVEYNPKGNAVRIVKNLAPAKNR
ncbi:MAG: ATP-binding protein [Planctomycetota bacterium]